MRTIIGSPELRNRERNRQTTDIDRLPERESKGWKVGETQTRTD